MRCWNVRTFSWIVAIFHVIVGFIATILLIALLSLGDVKKSEFFENYERERKGLLFVHICLLIYCLAMLACAITLVVGLTQNRSQLLMPFICVIFVGLLGNVIISGHLFFWGIRHKRAFGPLALDLFTYVMVAVVQAILLIPVYKLYKQMTTPTACAGQQILSINEPMVNKPYTIQEGHM